MTARMIAPLALAALLPACATMPTGPMTDASRQGAAVPQATGLFAQESALPFHAPDFAAISDTDYQPAIEQGIAIKLAEIEAIATNFASSHL